MHSGRKRFLSPALLGVRKTRPQQHGQVPLGEQDRLAIGRTAQNKSGDYQKPPDTAQREKRPPALEQQKRRTDPVSMVTCVCFLKAQAT